jgi:hypothetical protein
MHFSSKSLAPALFGLALLPLAAAVADDQHHQPEAQPPSTQMMPMMNMMGQSPSGMPMMNMMGQSPSGMPMMNMMGQGGMGMMGQGAMPMQGMPMLDMGAHLEGRVAFLRAELGITEAQAPQWEAFAQALRDSAAKLQQAQAAAPPSAAEPLAILQRAELQERWLAARLEGLKATKAAFASLQAVLSEDQKKTAEALLTRPVCFGQMSMM